MICFKANHSLVAPLVQFELLTHTIIMAQNDSRKVATVPVRGKIGPSILNANLADLVNECERLATKHEADYLHLDVMDGHFVPNLTFGHPLVKCLRDTLKERNCNPLFDMHMMVAHPEQWVEPMHDAGADLYTFHLEATEPRNVTQYVIRKIREAGMQVGVGIKPNTPVEDVLSLVDKVDMVLIMTVEPGFGGQSFMANMMPKVQKLRQMFPDLNIEVREMAPAQMIDEFKVRDIDFYIHLYLFTG